MSSRQQRQSSVGPSDYYQPTPVYSIYSGLHQAPQPTYYTPSYLSPPRRNSDSPVSDASYDTDGYYDRHPSRRHKGGIVPQNLKIPQYSRKDDDDLILASPKRRTRRVTLSSNLAYAFSTNGSDSSVEREHMTVPRQLRFDGKVMVQEISPRETTFGERSWIDHDQPEGTSTSSNASRSRTWCRLNGADGTPGQYPTLHMARVSYERQLREEMATHSISSRGSQSSVDDALEEEFRLLSLERSRQRTVSTSGYDRRTSSGRYNYV